MMTKCHRESWWLPVSSSLDLPVPPSAWPRLSWALLTFDFQHSQGA